MNIHDVVRPISRFFRKKRMDTFVRMFGLTDQHRVLDVGGFAFNWTLIQQQPHITMVNIVGGSGKHGRFENEIGDARSLRFGDNSFDICYSNSMIEHVGSWEDQKRCAREICRIAPRYYVQTPNKYFVLEPHLLTPFVQFLPKRIARRTLRNGTVYGLIARPNQEWIDQFLEQTRMLSIDEMRQLFPDAIILRETVFGLTKSLIAVRLRD